MFSACGIIGIAVTAVTVISTYHIYPYKCPLPIKTLGFYIPLNSQHVCNSGEKKLRIGTSPFEYYLKSKQNMAVLITDALESMKIRDKSL